MPNSDTSASIINQELESYAQQYPEKFKHSIANLDSPYGDGNASMRVIKALESINFNNKTQFLKKGFYDLKNE